MALTVFHAGIKNQRCVLGPYEVDFDENGHGVLEDEKYALVLINDGLGFALVEKEQQLEKKPDIPVVKTEKEVSGAEKPLRKSRDTV